MATSNTFQNLPTDKQERILDGALSEFADKGYARASLNSLVAALGIAKGSIFQYFRDKAGLFSHVFNFAVDLVKNHLRDVRDQTRGRDVFTRIQLSLMAGLDLIERNPRLFKLYLKIMFEGEIPFRAQLLQSILLFGRDYIMSISSEKASKRGSWTLNWTWSWRPLWWRRCWSAFWWHRRWSTWTRTWGSLPRAGLKLKKGPSRL
jgi:TetR/AcrR family transcriptional regulator